VRPLGEQLLSTVPPADAVHVLAQLEVAPLCMGHTLCWEGDTADSVWLLQVRTESVSVWGRWGPVGDQGAVLVSFSSSYINPSLSLLMVTTHTTTQTGG